MSVRARVTRLSVAILLTGAAVAVPVVSAGAAPIGAQARAVALHGAPVIATGMRGAAPTDAQCRAQIGYPCYSPQEVRRAYGLDGLTGKKAGGRGQTIVIIDSYGSPTLAADLAQFDADFGLPAPPSLRVLAPLGSVPFNLNGKDMAGWAEETSLDVQWSHAMAPNASIVVLTSPVDETEGVQGLPQFLELEQYAVAHRLGNVISQSWAATENSLFTRQGKALMARFDAFYRYATTRRGVTFLGSVGDSGTANPDVAGTTYPFPTVNFPAISPWVTAVGGTSLNLSTSGRFQSETVWNDGLGSATGGGVSQYFPEPFYQRLLPRATQKLLAGHRAIPDVSFNADPYTGVLVHLGFLGTGNDGYYIFGGTSEGSPAWAGIVADLDQQAGFPLGFLNPALYALGAAHVLTPAFLRDVTVGNNAQPPIAGYSAGPGWDAATGWGTPNLRLLGGALIHQDRLSGSSRS